MFFSIHHAMRFLYSMPVFVEPHTIRLRPRSDPHQRLIRFRLSLNPEPTGISHSLELEGNCASHVWFSGTHEFVEIIAMSEVQTVRTNPFDFIFCPPEAADVPMSYPEPLRTLLKPYCVREASDNDINSFANEVARRNKGKTIPFLQDLCQTISQGFTKLHRKFGEPLHPSETFAHRHGACRDLSLLFMEVCRVQGLASRFVSGYTRVADRNDNRELHAWSEVFLPGGGWRGYDPSLGVAVSDNHVALAASPIAQGAAPVHGSFRGTGVESTLEYEVDIRTSEEGFQRHGHTSLR